MATTGDIEARFTDARGADIDVTSTTPEQDARGAAVTQNTPERVDMDGFWIDRNRAYVFWSIIVILYIVTLVMMLYLFTRSTNQLSSLDSSETWTRLQLEQILNILTQNSEDLSRATKAIFTNQYTIYQAVNGTATNMLIQNQNLANFITAESHNIAAMKAVLQGLGKG